MEALIFWGVVAALVAGSWLYTRVSGKKRTAEHQRLQAARAESEARREEARVEIQLRRDQERREATKEQWQLIMDEASHAQALFTG